MDSDNPSIKEFESTLKILASIPILLFCVKNPPRLESILYGFSTGAILGGLRAIWDVFYTHQPRAFYWMNAIQGGDISMSLGLLSFCALFFAIKKSHRGAIIYFSIATIMGFTGSILSGSRGGWLLLPIIIFMIYKTFNNWLEKKHKKAISITLLLVVLACLIPQSGVVNRLTTAKSDITRYLSKEDNNTSLGRRFEYWKSAIYSFSEKPIFGWGDNGIKSIRIDLFNKGLISKIGASDHAHAHNQFLEEMEKRGILGLSSLFLILLLPLKIFRERIINSNSPEDRVIAGMGAVIIISVIDYNLSQAFLLHNSGIIFYTTSIIILLSALPQTNQEVIEND